MIEIGYSLSSEEFGPTELIQQAQKAERAGFDFAMISDHFHPWTRRQGQSPFVWSVIGGIAMRTDRIRIGTGVTCPLIRIHPAVIAQASATAALMMPGRFILGLGTGENLNEHVAGAKWPSPGERLEMLEEAITIIRELWKGELVNHHARHYTVENAQIFSSPETPPEIFVAAAQPGAARLAARFGQGLISTAPKKELIEEFVQAGGEGKPRYGQMAVCWSPSKEQGIHEAREIWPNALVNGAASQELPLPKHFEQLTEDVPAELMSTLGAVTCGPDAAEYIRAINKYVEAGFDHIYIHQIGPRQDEFMQFASQELIPEFATHRNGSLGRDHANV